MKKIILSVSVLLVLSVLIFTQCNRLEVDKDGKNIYDKLSDAFNDYDKPLIDSILTTKIDLSNKHYTRHFNIFLQQAMEQNDILRFNKLVEKGIVVSDEDIPCNGRTLRQRLLTKGNIDYLRIWLEKKNRLKNIDFALIEAVQYSNLEAVKLLLQKGANIDYNIYSGQQEYLSPLAAAISVQNMEIFQFLIAKKANLNQPITLWKDRNDENKKATLLHYLTLSIADKSNQYNYNYKEIALQMAGVLINKGVNVNAVTSQNLKAIDFLGFDFFQNKSPHQNIWLAEYLIQRGTNLQTSSYSTVANAMRFQNTQNLTILAQKGLIKWNQVDFSSAEFQNTAYVNALSGIKLREFPSTSANAIESIAYQESVTTSNFTTSLETIEGLSGNWVYVDFQGKKGFVFSGFLNQ